MFQNRRWDGDYLTLRKALADGELGEVRWLEMAWDRFGAPGGWRGQAEMGGGRFYDLGAHLADQLVMLFPQAIQSVYCRMHYDFPETDVESEAMFIVKFADGRTGVCDLSSLSAISKPRFYARGTARRGLNMASTPQEEAMKAGDIDAAREDPKNYARLHDNREERIIPTLPGRWRSYYENIADVLTHGAELAVKPETVRRGIAVLDAALRSAKSGQVVEVDVPAL